ncbi:signal transduction histidine kinase [Murinocardiopsis flavida]|uniref:Signal transduction histidine kinase n=1 Tax=Murinocardiopsis flavida TaxID=645275 RepID=A0A2P8D036_9ACTN|nr:DUF5931 domain-containing protein [Murinocardiopsis flavida]PSK90574.1 signal transduction histidine kinase [Murinocardiopsis flavida]
MGFEAPLWRGIAVFRVASLVYAVAIVVQQHRHLDVPWVAWTVLAVMACWTAVTTRTYPRLSGDRQRHAMVWADLLVAGCCLMATIVAATPAYLKVAPPLTATWFGAAALAAVVVRGRGWALGVPLAYGVADNVIRLVLQMDVSAATARGVILLVLAGLAVGYMVHVAAEAEERLSLAAAMEARTRERERLARSIHDSVLQVLAMVQRRGSEAGGEAAELGRLAGEQEAKLRSLIAADDTGTNVAVGGALLTSRETGGARAARSGRGAQSARRTAGGGTLAAWRAARGSAQSAQRTASGDQVAGHPSGPADLRPLLGAHASASVTVSTPATPVLFPAHIAAEVADAVGAALANVERHCGPDTRAWVLVEDETEAATVTVRDDGPGMEPDRIAEAEAAGRLGIAQSIKGRIHDAGGTVDIVSTPGEGVEIEMHIPHKP